MKRISIIIATYNRAEQLLLTLASVAEQSLPSEQWECVVVDNNSKDNTQAVVAEFIERHLDLDFKVVKECRQGLSYARNCGIESSIGEVVAIIDDDEVINADFAAAYLSLFDQYPSCESAGGAIIPRYKTGRPRWMSHYTELPIANPLDLGAKPRLFPRGRIPGGGNMAVRRSTLERSGLFDVELGRKGDKLIGGEESDLFERLAAMGAECWWCPDAVMWHIIPPQKLKRSYFDRLAYNIGVSQRLRAKIEGRRALPAEMLKWCATLAIALFYVVTLQWGKAKYLTIMRWNITRGILNKE